MVGLAGRQKDEFSKYSLGMKQRLALAATMIGSPELIILDEPANGLDPEGMREIRDIIGNLADAGKTIFLSSHLLWEVERTCSHVAIIQRGQLIKTSSISDITSSGVSVLLRAPDLPVLHAIVESYPETKSVRTEDEDVVVELNGDDFAGLNEYIVSKGVYVSRLTPRPVSLEEVFMDLTGASERGMGDVK
jgi:ABC-2 type transport system ATP-binding protein